MNDSSISSYSAGKGVDMPPEQRLFIESRCWKTARVVGVVVAALLVGFSVAAACYFPVGTAAFYVSSGAVGFSFILFAASIIALCHKSSSPSMNESPSEESSELSDSESESVQSEEEVPSSATVVPDFVLLPPATSTEEEANSIDDLFHLLNSEPFPFTTLEDAIENPPPTYKSPSHARSVVEYLQLLQKESSILFTEEIPDFFDQYFTEKEKRRSDEELEKQLRRDVQGNNVFFMDGKPVDIVETLQALPDKQLAKQLFSLCSQIGHLFEAQLIFDRYTPPSQVTSYSVRQYTISREERQQETGFDNLSKKIGANLITCEGKIVSLALYDAYEIISTDTADVMYYIPAKMEVDLEIGSAVINWIGPSLQDNLKDIHGIMGCFSK